MKAVLVHGFNVRDGGAKTIDKFAFEFRDLGYTVDIDEADYGYFSLLKIYFGGKREVIRRLMSAFKDADIIVTHSNGASFANKALNEMPPRLEGNQILVHFSPALDRKTKIPYSITHQFVYHTRKDLIVKLSTWLPMLPWGRMGATGYKGKGPNTNVDYTFTVEGHSNWFNGANAVNFPRDVHERVLEYL